MAKSTLICERISPYNIRDSVKTQADCNGVKSWH